MSLHNLCSDDKNQNNLENSPEIRIPVNKKTIKYVFAVIIFAGAVYWAANHTDSLLSIAGSIFSVISPFIIGLCLAFIGNVFLEKIERLWEMIFKKKSYKITERMKRPACIFISSFLIAIFIFAVVFMLIPGLKNSISSFISNMPVYGKNLTDLWEKITNLLEQYNFNIPEITFDAEKLIQTGKQLISDYGALVVDKTVDITSSVASVIINVSLGIVFSFYVLYHKDNIGRQAKKSVYAFLSKERADKLLAFLEMTRDTFTKFVSGQLTESIIIGILCFVGMLIFKMPYAAVISVLVGVTALIPVFGAFFGTAVGAFMIFLVDPLKALWFVIFIIVLQQMEGDIIYPRVVGKTIGLPGIWVLTAVTIGGSAFGILGMLFSVPVCAVLYCLFRDIVNKRLKEKNIDINKNT